MQFSSHHRSFVGTTVLAIFISTSLIVLLGTILYVPWWAAGQHGLAEWGMLLLVGLAAIALSAVAAVATLVAIGDLVVIARDRCEERGAPYFPVRPRERIAGPMRLAIRRLLNPNAGLRPGELVEVRSLPEILASLDERGCLDGLPFMPEMAAFCGHRVPVHRRVEKVWEYAHGTGNRGLEFGEDMLFYCGGSYRVAASINRIVREGTGELLQLKTPSILLEGVTAIGGAILNPQNEFYYWREIWLDPKPTPAEVSPDGRASLPATGEAQGSASARNAY